MHYSYGDQISLTVKEVVLKGGYDKVISSTSAFGKDVIPRLGGLLDTQPITDVVQVLVSNQSISTNIVFRKTEPSL